LGDETVNTDRKNRSARYASLAEERKMKPFIVAAVAALASCSAALAAPPGQWMDTHSQMALGNLPESDPEIGRLNYAKALCRPQPIYAPFNKCMGAQGFVFVYDTPEQVAAREQAIRAEQSRAFLNSVGQAMTSFGNDMSQPRPQCPPNVLRMNCN
jgi:hypothetical protein